MKKSYEFLKHAIYFKYLDPPGFNLHVCPIILGYESCTANKDSIGPIVKSHYILHMVLSGRGFYKINDEEYTIKSGDVFLIPPAAKISYRPDTTDPWKYLWLECNGAECKTVFDKMDLTTESPIFAPQNFSKLACELADMLEESSAATGGLSLNCVSHMFKIFSLIADERIKKDEKSGIRSESPLMNALEFIERNYCDSTLSVTTLADAVGFTVPYLSRLFKAHIGMSPSKYIIELRMRKACAMLDTNVFSISEIASATGYNSPFYFSNEFKRHVGVSPSRYQSEKDITH